MVAFGGGYSAVLLGNRVFSLQGQLGEAPIGAAWVGGDSLGSRVLLGWWEKYFGSAGEGLLFW